MSLKIPCPKCGRRTYLDKPCQRCGVTVTREAAAQKPPVPEPVRSRGDGICQRCGYGHYECDCPGGPTLAGTYTPSRHEVY